ERREERSRPQARPDSARDPTAVHEPEGRRFFRLSPHSFLLSRFVGRFHPGRCSWVLAFSTSPPGAVFFQTVVPAPTVVSLATVTGATSCTSEPICTLSSITVLCLSAPS